MKNTAICIACSWFRARVEKVNPTARLRGDEQSEADEKQEHRAVDGDLEHAHCRREDEPYLHVAEEDVGDDLPQHHLERTTGIARRFSIVPRSRSRVTASAVMTTRVKVSSVPISPGTML